MKIGVESLIASTPEEIIDGYRLLKEWGFDAADAGIYAPLTAGEISKKVVHEALCGSDRDVLKIFEPTPSTPPTAWMAGTRHTTTTS